MLKITMSFVSRSLKRQLNNFAVFASIARLLEHCLSLFTGEFVEKVGDKQRSKCNKIIHV